ncbi:MAG: hypothetical protein EXR67_04335 [Dehalococcoidia bacterium]|nr:hypothetical protein [Dehalococcoidia bacterium]
MRTVIAVALAAVGAPIMIWGAIGFISVIRTYNGIHDTLVRFYLTLIVIGILTLAATLALWLIPKYRHPQ